MNYRVRGVPQDIADEVRRTHVSPGYGHPAHAEVATGTGPCRCCLRPFIPGVERRLLFTYRPSVAGSLTAPGPVFIHADHCQAPEGDGFPESLHSLDLSLEARASGSRVLDFATCGDSPERQIQRLFNTPGVEWLQLRHAVAGCFIATIQNPAAA
jgi:Protein of unknown function (DUF1203)